ncbi:hypothetical protein [Streptomyces sp. NPDC056244]|uniref:hypothetical protein n=1 Tax=Streptomyces sp. NPDC056244 TaxID=3345762 RepID=UPI0035D940CE
MAREALAHLRKSAGSCQTEVTTSNRPYLGDIASLIAEHLPGPWQVTVENFALPDRKQERLSWLWAKDLVDTLKQYPVPCGAVLRGGSGAEFLLIERPWDGQYLVGALEPGSDYTDSPVAAPRNVVATASTVASAVRTRLLPAYEHSVRLLRLYEAEADLGWARETFEPGMSEPYPTGLASKLDEFRTHVPEFLAAIRRDARALTADEAALVDRIEAAFGRDRRATEESVSTDAMALWLAEGEHLIELARAIPPAIPATARPLPPAAAPPPAAGTGHGPRR